MSIHIDPSCIGGSARRRRALARRRRAPTVSDQSNEDSRGECLLQGREGTPRWLRNVASLPLLVKHYTQNTHKQTCKDTSLLQRARGGEGALAPSCRAPHGQDQTPTHLIHIFFLFEEFELSLPHPTQFSTYMPTCGGRNSKFSKKLFI